MAAAMGPAAIECHARGDIRRDDKRGLARAAAEALAANALAQGERIALFVAREDAGAVVVTVILAEVRVRAVGALISHVAPAHATTRLPQAVSMASAFVETPYWARRPCRRKGED